MSEEKSAPDNVNAVVVTAPSKTNAVLSTGQFIISLVTVTLAIATVIAGGVNSINARIADLTQENIQQNSRIGILEKKADAYDKLSDQQQRQYNDTTERLVRIETLLGARSRRDKNSDGGL